MAVGRRWLAVGRRGCWLAVGRHGHWLAVGRRGRWLAVGRHGRWLAVGRHGRRMAVGVVSRLLLVGCDEQDVDAADRRPQIPWELLWRRAGPRAEVGRGSNTYHGPRGCHKTIRIE